MATSNQTVFADFTVKHSSKMAEIKNLKPSLIILNTWYQRAKQRRLLAKLESHLLADIGISKKQAMAEASKPFWKK